MNLYLYESDHWNLLIAAESRAEADDKLAKYVAQEAAKNRDMGYHFTIAVDDWKCTHEMDEEAVGGVYHLPFSIAQWSD